MPTDGSEPVMQPPSETPTPTAAEAVEVRIGEDDHSRLDWRVTCSSLDTSPTVIASATDEDETEYVVVVVGAGTDALASFTFTRTEQDQSTRERAGLTVNPGGNHGNGSLIVDDDVVSSTGRGIAYDATNVDTEASTTYSVKFSCPQ